MSTAAVGDIGLMAGAVNGATRMPEPHRHAEVEVNYIVSGRMDYWFSAGPVSLGPGCMAAFWAAYPHRAVATDSTLEFHWLTLPLPMFLAWKFPQPLVDALMSGALIRQEHAGPADEEARRWRGWAAAFTGRSPAGFPLDVLRWEIRARMGRFALEAAVLDQTRLRRATGLSRGVEKMVRHIGEHYREPVKVADIAAAAGLNPNYATEAFRKVFGLGIKDYLNRQRIAEAQRLLLSTEDTVLEIAYQCGFASPSRFHEWFQRLCGTSPEEYRKRYTQGSRSHAR